MPFTFKLSQRLARMRCAALLASAALAACEKPAVTLTEPNPTIHLQVSPKSVTLSTGGTSQLMAVGLTPTGDTAQIAVSWSVTGGAVTDTSTKNGQHYGRYKAGADTGKFKVVARGVGSGASDTATVTVIPPPVASVRVTPAIVSLFVGTAVQLTATTTDSAGNLLSGRSIAWSTSNAAVASVNGTGLTTGLAPGSATITATSQGVSGTAAIAVSKVPVASVQVLPASASILVGQTVQLAATPKDSAGTTLTGRTVTWASSNTSVATVSSSGLVTGIVAGT